MKILFLLRQQRGGIVSFAHRLAEWLGKRGIEVTLEQSEAWIPNETGPRVDKAVAERLRKIGEDYDLVHAFGYRSAWACAATYAEKEAWCYTAYDLPKTTHRMLINNLNTAQIGFCSSRAVFRALDESLAIDLRTVHPGIDAEQMMPQDKVPLRAALGFKDEEFWVGGMGRFVPERGFLQLIEGFAKSALQHGQLKLAIAGDGPEESSLRQRVTDLRIEDKVRFFPWQNEPSAFLRALDLFVVPSTRAGFSTAAIEAMALAVPVLLRDTGGLREIAEADVSGLYFLHDDDIETTISELVDLPLTLETVAHGGRIRVLDQFNIENAVAQIVDGYEQALGD